MGFSRGVNRICKDTRNPPFINANFPPGFYSSVVKTYNGLKWAAKHLEDTAPSPKPTVPGRRRLYLNSQLLLSRSGFFLFFTIKKPKPLCSLPIAHTRSQFPCRGCKAPKGMGAAAHHGSQQTKGSQEGELEPFRLFSPGLLVVFSSLPLEQRGIMKHCNRSNPRLISLGCLG